jgi:glycerol-3-phosphate responsive antiterminator
MINENKIIKATSNKNFLQEVLNKEVPILLKLQNKIIITIEQIIKNIKNSCNGGLK